jgi:hypothetical protein
VAADPARVGELAANMTSLVFVATDIHHRCSGDFAHADRLGRFG